MTDLEQLTLDADSGNAEAQYNLSVHYLNTGNPDDIKLAYKYCLLAVNNGFDHAAYNLGLMYTDGSTPVWDAIATDTLLKIAKSVNVPNSDQELYNLHKKLDTYKPFARVNPHLYMQNVPQIQGVKESLVKFKALLDEGNNVYGELCGRLGSIKEYPMIELRRSCDFISVGGTNLMDNPSNGICLVMTFIQNSPEPRRSSLEEAFWHMKFQELECFNDFVCHMCYNVTNSANMIADIWEYTLDCGGDIEKAEKIACTILYHIYGYKKTSMMYPPIVLNFTLNGCRVVPIEKSDSLSMVYYNIEQFGLIDLVLGVIGIVISFIFIKDSTGSIILAISLALCTLCYSSVITSKFKKLKFPKRNYIRFFRDPNAEW